MSLRFFLILLTTLSILSKTVAGLSLLFLGTNLPIIVQLFSGALIAFGITLLIYYKFNTFNPFPFIIFLLSEILIIIINLFVINYQFSDKWYNVHFPMFEQIVIGNFIDVAINSAIVFYYFGILRRSFPKK